MLQAVAHPAGMSTHGKPPLVEVEAEAPLVELDAEAPEPLLPLLLLLLPVPPVNALTVCGGATAVTVTPSAVDAALGSLVYAVSVDSTLVARAAFSVATCAVTTTEPAATVRAMSEAATPS